MLSSTDIFAIIRWWLALMALGIAVTPLTYTLFNRLADKGYAFTKMIGLLLVSYLFWILGSLGFLGNNLGGILFALALVTGLSFWALNKNRADFRTWLGKNGRYILITELLFLAVFVFWAWARAQHPEISATEKPMEFAFLNAAVRTPTFPPIDPWLSGFAISYYYFGYVMVSVITRLAVVPTALGFNLALAWLVAGTAVSSFGLVYNLIASRGDSARKTAVYFALIAALAIPIVGNQQITLEVLYANRVGSDQFWQWLDVKDLNNGLPAEDSTPRYESGAWWWWRSSRPINEYTIGDNPSLEPIVEFPAFSFILGDIHPHVLALPFALLSLGLAFVWYLESRQLAIDDWQLSIVNLKALMPNWPLFIITTIILGGLSFLNTWDVLIHMFVVLGAFALGQWQRRGVWQSAILTKTAVLAVTILIPAVILYFPFYVGFQSQAGAPYILPMLNQPTRLPQFFIVFGMPLTVLLLFLSGLAIKQRFKEWRALLGTAVGSIIALLLLSLLLAWIIASSAEGAGSIINFAAEAGITLPPRPGSGLSLGWGIRAVFSVLPAYLLMKLKSPLTTTMLALMLGTIVMVWTHLFKKYSVLSGQYSEDSEQYSVFSGQSSGDSEQYSEDGKQSPNLPISQSPNTPITQLPNYLPFTLLLILTATLLTLGPEFVYLRDNFGVRMNTIFKFYYQAWVMFGIGAIVALEIMWREWKTKIPAGAASLAYVALFVAALQFPYYAIQSRGMEYRGVVNAENRLPATLNGLAKLEQFNPDEYAAMMWLSENADGLPVVLEATGGAYSSYGRISANTGLPTVLGWANHEFQWRGDTPEPNERTPAIEQIYSNTFWDNTGQLLDQYDVEYIYVGNLERSAYGNNGELAGLNKFNDLLEVAYQNNSVTIYRWHPE